MLKGLIRKSMHMTAEIKEKLPKIYSRELINLLFNEFHTKIQYIEEGLGVSRRTSVNYLTALEREGFLVSEKLGKERIYHKKPTPSENVLEKDDRQNDTSD